MKLMPKHIILVLLGVVSFSFTSCLGIQQKYSSETKIKEVTLAHPYEATKISSYWVYATATAEAIRREEKNALQHAFFHPVILPIALIDLGSSLIFDTVTLPLDLCNLRGFIRQLNEGEVTQKNDKMAEVIQ